MGKHAYESDQLSNATRLREIRDWQRRLRQAHDGGYRLHDMSVETVICNVAFLIAKLDARSDR